MSATHLDVSMVPYVRKSFLKHFRDGLKYIEGMSDEDIKKFEEELKNYTDIIDKKEGINDNVILENKD